MNTDDERSIRSTDNLMMEMENMENGRVTTGESTDDDDTSARFSRTGTGTSAGAAGEVITDEEQDDDDYDDEDDDDDGDAAELSWRKLEVLSPNGKKVLLHEACGRVKGRFLAIMGPSGAGKVRCFPSSTNARCEDRLSLFRNELTLRCGDDGRRA